MKKSPLKKIAAAFGLALLVAGCTTAGKLPASAEVSSARTVFLAGATGVLGAPLGKALIDKGYTVYGTTRSPEKAVQLERKGIKPVVLNVFDAPALEKAVADAAPAIVINQLSDLPQGLPEDQMEEGIRRDNRMRTEGTQNLIRAAMKANVPTFITQSVGMLYAPGNEPLNEESPFISMAEDKLYGSSAEAVKDLERQVENAGFSTAIILRYGWLYGTGTGFDAPVEGYPSLNVDAAVAATVAALEAGHGKREVYQVSDESPQVDTRKFDTAFPQWRAGVR